LIKQIAHVGIAVTNLEQVREFFHSTFKIDCSPITEDEGLKVCMLNIDNSKLELMEPTDNKGAVAKFLEKRGEGIHHICFEVDNIDQTIESLKTQGVELVNNKPRPGAEGKIIFAHPRSMHGMLVEFVEKY